MATQSPSLANATPVGKRDADASGSRKESISSGHIVDVADHEAGHEAADVLHKRYNFTTLVSMFIALSAGWESIVVSLYQALLGGGPTVLFWGYTISAVGAMCTTCSLAEFASIWPSAAGQSHWTVALAPPGLRRTLGWYAAWILLCMTVLSSIGANFAFALSMQSVIAIANPDYVPERYQTYLIFVAVILLAMLINIFAPRLLHHISIFGLVVHVLGFFAISITLLATAEKNSPKLVFATIQDNTGWNSDGAAFLVGMLPGAYGFLAIDSSARFSEETAKPRTDVSRAMFWGVLGSIAIGIPFVLIIAFCMGDPAVMLQSPLVSLNPLALIVIQATGSNAAGIALSCTIIVVAFMSAIDCIGCISRIIMAQARDRALPFGEHLSKIHPRWNTPVYAVVLAVFLEISVAAIYVGNSTAYYGIASGTVTIQVLSYIIPISLHLIYGRKLKLEYGPWNLGKYRYVINIAALIIYSFLFVIMSFPIQLPVNAGNMNYASALFGGVFFLATTTYLFWGRKYYHGPMISLRGLTDQHASEVQ